LPTIALAASKSFVLLQRNYPAAVASLLARVVTETIRDTFPHELVADSRSSMPPTGSPAS
jgi:hypothetical protein